MKPSLCIEIGVLRITRNKIFKNTRKPTNIYQRVAFHFFSSEKRARELDGKRGLEKGKKAFYTTGIWQSLSLIA
jgi:hypothetical protein